METEKTLVFMDVQPLSEGHCLVIPKTHAAKLHQLDEESAADLLPTALKVVKALGIENYNILQNNGRIAHQMVDHVHFHIIPRPDEHQGLGLKWHPITVSKEELKSFAEKTQTKL